ncbi:vWA domain-containing protein [Bacillus thermotolerans]|uniref:Nitric oxide reductase activation protein NorD n=1 Tax=Bacillus thermotolerans TaxID=1221996 RepID=A0A0F5I1M1_BACTR|nr:hypothetical protein [Bacillus thermotolerans]KKB35424.1 Nitric oxide reductase activation protein NorD [Bacillus thermotolerans]KKB39022.1 Nitric oxide reductase activation protein NorD [Bacillus thermotolerans]KKB40875.1 Nitric oxide reductase activation protein NorD [Bacillus thermotolerans]
MKRFIQFNDEIIDSFLFMQLSDLSKTLTRNPSLEVEYRPHAYIHKAVNKLYVSHFWSHRPAEDTWLGFASDVYLRAAGSWFHTDEEEIERFLHRIQASPVASTAKQLAVMSEDIRLEEICKKERPGTKPAFAARRRMYRQYFTAQLNTNLVKSLPADSLLNALFLMLHANAPFDPPLINKEIEGAMPFLQRSIMSMFEVRSTREVIRLTEDITEVLEEILEKDALNQYFHLPELSLNEDEGERFDDLKRKDPLANDDRLEKEKTGEEEIEEEEFRTWHRETSDLGESFLQFDLDQGTQTDLMGEGIREGEAGDQALAMVQGSAQETSRKDFSHLPAEQMKKEVTGGGEAAYGKENRFAIPIFKKAAPPKPEEAERYKKQQARIVTLQKKLKHMMEKMLEHKRTAPRSDLHAGRLNKKLLRFFLEDQPRLFYKKQELSADIDASFTLLVDCSASMEDKMEQTKLGIVLFHEALKSVNVPHEIIGFWEDTGEATETKQPNYFYEVITYDTSLKASSGPEVMQLEAEEDNRDGFAIRVLTERIRKRQEKQKFLFIFSDGEPAAYSYDQNGIIDTHEAVLEARRLGIEVMNIFLANDEITEAERATVQNIYGDKYSLFLTDLEELPQVLFPLLRKLLYKSIQ